MPAPTRPQQRGSRARMVLTIPIVIVLGLFLYTDEIRTGKPSLRGRLRRW